MLTELGLSLSLNSAFNCIGLILSQAFSFLAEGVGMEGRCFYELHAIFKPNGKTASPFQKPQQKFYNCISLMPRLGHMPIALVCSDGCNKYRQRGLNNRHLFVTGNDLFPVLEAESSRWRCQHDSVLGRDISLACGRPPLSPCPPVVERALVASSSYKDTHPIIGSPSSWPHRNPSTSKGPPYKYHPH